MLRRFVLLAILLPLIACGAPVAAVPTIAPTAALCGPQAAAFITAIQPIISEWSDASTLAGNTARASLSPQIEKLQEIRRRVEALDVPACASPARDHFVNGMNAAINGYLAFQRQDAETEVNDYFAIGMAEIEAFTKSLALLPTVDTLPPAVMVTGGLGVSHDTFIAAFPTRTFTPRTIGSVTGWTSRADDNTFIEIYGPASNLVYATYNGAAKQDSQVDMETLLATVLPDWSDGKTWLAAAMKDSTSAAASTAIGGRVVRLDRSIGVPELTITAP